MLKSHLRLSCACTLPIVLCWFSVAQELNPAHKELLANSLRLEKRVSETQRRQLSSATQNRFALAHEILEVNPRLAKFRKAPTTTSQIPQNQLHHRSDDGIKMVPISSPAFDYNLSRGGDSAKATHPPPGAARILSWAITIPLPTYTRQPSQPGEASVELPSLTTLAAHFRLRLSSVQGRIQTRFWQANP